MRINPALLLLILLLIVFTPSIHEWITETNSAWYRPYIAWFILIVFVFVSQRSVSNNEH
ncbi:MAG: energy-coupling factor transporter transmembrane protein EcfT [Pseudohongiellaceae bacterium]|jgi:energy-coupling factor transporter transmembrane protein EcfT